MWFPSCDFYLHEMELWNLSHHQPAYALYYLSRKKVARPFPPPSCLPYRADSPPWAVAAASKNRLCVGHNSPLARPFRRTRIILLDVAITWPIIVTQPFYSKTDRYLYLRNPSKTVKQRQGFSQFSSPCEGEKSICRFIMSIRKVFLWECNNDDYIWQSTFV